MYSYYAQRRRPTAWCSHFSPSCFRLEIQIRPNKEYRKARWLEAGKPVPSPRTGHNINDGFERKASAPSLKCLELGHKLKYELNAKGSMVPLAKDFDLRRKLKLEQCQSRSVREESGLKKTYPCFSTFFASQSASFF